MSKNDLHHYRKAASSFKEELRQKLEKAGEDTTSHGIPHIIQTKNNCLRLMWILFFTASFAYCAYFVIKSLIAYSKYETNISIDYIQETPAQFPAVTVCNRNPFVLNRNNTQMRYFMSKFDNGECQMKYVDMNTTNESIHGLMSCYNVTSSHALITRQIDKLKRYVLNENMNDQNRSSMGFDLKNDMLLSCEYNKEPCNADNFTKFWSKIYGNCYTFNDGIKTSVLQSNKYGPRYGLILEMIVLVPNAENYGTYGTTTYGLYVFIHNQSVLPSTLTKSISISANIESYIGIKRTFRSKLGSPYSNCLDNLKPFSAYSKKLFNYFAQSNITYYNQEMCYNFCYQDLLVDKCNCSDLITNSIRNTNYCATEAEISCLRQFESYFSLENTDNLCDNSCPAQCDYYIYDTTIKEARYPSDSYAWLLGNDSTTARLIPPNSNIVRSTRELALRAIINYDELTYTNIAESASMSVEDLFGNIGGQLGLFIGISFLSLLEIIQCLVEICILFRKSRLKKLQKIQEING